MNKRNFIENLKTVVLVVLFFIAILLLYLNVNQNGESFTIDKIIPGGIGRSVNLSVEDYLLPEYSLQTQSDGSMNISFENRTAVMDAVEQSAYNLLASSVASVSSVDKSEYDAALMCKDSIISIFSFDMSFDDFSNKVVGKKIEAPEGCRFSSILFSDQAKDCFYMRSSSGEYYKMQAGENYYAINVLSRALSFEDDFVESFNIYNIDEIKKEFGITQHSSDLVFESDTIAENIFGDTFDFVRKITDSFGNETYMYGYGEKRFSHFASNGAMEYKEEMSGENKKSFYDDLELALLFVVQTLDIDADDIRLTKTYTETENEQSYNCYAFQYFNYKINCKIYGERVVYFAMTK